MADSKFEKLKKEATKLGIPFDEKVEEEALGKLVAEKKAAEIEERKRNKEKEDQAKKLAEKNEVVLKNVFGEDIDQEDYFYSKEHSGKGKAPTYFNRTCGMPVDRDDMIVIFNRIFKPEHGFLFYKARDKEVYLVIVPLKYASTIGDHNESLEGDFQKHAISFIAEGSVNLESLRMKLERVKSTIKIEA
jgi:hypothetical protein